jgi:hypothetical protein
MSHAGKFFVLCDRYVDFYRLAFAFSALRQPSTETFGEALRCDTKASLDASVGNGQSVVKFRRIGETSHTELIEPLQRARAPLSGDDYVNLEPLGVQNAPRITAGPSVRPRLFAVRLGCCPVISNVRPPRIIAIQSRIGFRRPAHSKPLEPATGSFPAEISRSSDRLVSTVWW